MALLPFDHYEGREQTFLKHFFLDKYLEKVAFNIGSFKQDFVYVDGFSGPWVSSDEDYKDTSFGIALEKLRYVRSGLQKNGKDLNLKCLFIEKSKKPFNDLKNEISKVTDLEAEAINGEFENLIPQIKNYIGNSFSLIFIDPKGWTGYGLEKIKPLLNLPGEIIINFMYDHINRFIVDPPEELKDSFEELGGPGFLEEVLESAKGKSREEAILSVYCQRLKTTGNFAHVVSTRILFRDKDRPYFYLIYCTRHQKGLFEFREVEKKSFIKQNFVRGTLEQNHRIEQSGQGELFGPDCPDTGSQYLINFRENQLNKAHAQLNSLLEKFSKISGEEIKKHLLENEFVWKSDINEIVFELEKSGKIEIINLVSRERTLKDTHMIRGK